MKNARYFKGVDLRLVASVSTPHDGSATILVAVPKSDQAFPRDALLIKEAWARDDRWELVLDTVQAAVVPFAEAVSLHGAYQEKQGAFEKPEVREEAAARLLGDVDGLLAACVPPECGIAAEGEGRDFRLAAKGALAIRMLPCDAVAKAWLSAMEDSPIW